jgi:hypothetical protein
MRPHHTVRLAKKLRETGVPVIGQQHPPLGYGGPALNRMRPFRQQTPLYRDVAGLLTGVIR